MSTIRQSIKSATKAVKKAASSVLGTFTGKCLDTNVFNNNDWRASRPVFETLMASDEYKRAMKYGHYIGFAGHPQDSDCQDFEHACIVMKDMRLLDNGEVEGDFDLVDTPVGRIVKAFIDAGVQFGISIRGLGDIGPDGEIDPDEFIFRGFDLVTFPAYDDCIPEFKAIAASTDAKKKAKYKKICASIDANLQDVRSCEALAFIQEQLPEGSEEFNKIQNRIDEINSEDALEELIEDDLVESPEEVDITEDKLNAVMTLYLDSAEQVRDLEDKLADAQSNNQTLVIECKTLKQKQARLNRLAANQINDANDEVSDLRAKCSRVEKQLNKVRASLSTTRSQLSDTADELEDTKKELRASKIACNRQISSNERLKNQLDTLNNKRKADLNSIKSAEDLNLKYLHKIEANSKLISKKDAKIEDLKSKLHETVVANSELKSESSNLDDKNAKLSSRISAAEKKNAELAEKLEACEELVTSYQQAYANLYANALGVYLTGLPITATTSVEELTAIIKAGTSTAGMSANPSYYDEDEEVEDPDYIEGDEGIFDEADYSAEMVTL